MTTQRRHNGGHDPFALCYLRIAGGQSDPLIIFKHSLVSKCLRFKTRRQRFFCFRSCASSCSVKRTPHNMKESEPSLQLNAANFFLSNQGKKTKLRMHSAFRVRIRAANTGALQKNSGCIVTTQHKDRIRKNFSAVMGKVPM